MNSWQVAHQCPQCGAPVTLEETDRLFACPYCRVRLYLAAAGPCHYYIPPSHSHQGEIFYVPYWRLKGISFAARAEQIDHRLLDTSLPAFSCSALPQSLGFRPQALSLLFATPELPGSWLAVQKSLSTVVSDLTAGRLPGGLPAGEYAAFIGEVSSLIYAPIGQSADGFRDAIDGTILTGMTAAEGILQHSESRGPSWQHSFVPALCPACGWDLEGDRESLVLLCSHCDTAWTASPAGLRSMAWGVSPTVAKGELLQVPFWRLEVAVDGLELTSYADLIRQANIPKVAAPAWNERRLCFWLPAFKIRPQLFLRLARQMTIKQIVDEPERRVGSRRFYPVTLPLAEALESLTVLLATMIMPKKRIFPLLPHLKITLQDAVLIFQPFAAQGQDFVAPSGGGAVHRNAFRWGRQL